VPATDASKLAKAAQLDVDEVVIDLEDSIPKELKNDATRRSVAEAVAKLPWRAASVAVRVNATDTP
jgi:citrate lyase beta subunit